MDPPDHTRDCNCETLPKGSSCCQRCTAVCPAPTMPGKWDWGGPRQTDRLLSLAGG